MVYQTPDSARNRFLKIPQAKTQVSSRGVPVVTTGKTWRGVTGGCEPKEGSFAIIPGLELA
jgi:hypothetical protein